MSGGVLIVGEVVDRGLHPTVRQLVNAAGRIGGDVSLCLAVDGSFDSEALEGLDVGSVVLLEHPDAVADGVGGIYSLLSELVCAQVERLRPSSCVGCQDGCWFGCRCTSGGEIRCWVGFGLHRFGSKCGRSGRGYASGSWGQCVGGVRVCG